MRYRCHRRVSHPNMATNTATKSDGSIGTPSVVIDDTHQPASEREVDLGRRICEEAQDTYTRAPEEVTVKSSNVSDHTYIKLEGAFSASTIERALTEDEELHEVLVYARDGGRVTVEYTGD